MTPEIKVALAFAAAIMWAALFWVATEPDPAPKSERSGDINATCDGVTLYVTYKDSVAVALNGCVDGEPRTNAP